MSGRGGGPANMGGTLTRDRGLVPWLTRARGDRDLVPWLIRTRGDLTQTYKTRDFEKMYQDTEKHSTHGAIRAQCPPVPD